ncbi:hypothetical protein [Effusibacillus consociatus]|uniref:Uncharacterized protein n=1 Tax=Effusibacillus consociatus TaxID=1117041 RepID=A0ABV9PY51_9BACL
MKNFYKCAIIYPSNLIGFMEIVLMINKLLSWFKEECPHCKQQLIGQGSTTPATKACPDGHYKVETHPLLDVQIEYHTK